MTGTGRVDSNNGTSFSGDNAGGVRLQQLNYNLSAFAGKSVDHMEFESTGGSGNNRTFLAVSGVATAVPEPASIALVALGTAGLVARRRRLS